MSKVFKWIVNIIFIIVIALLVAYLLLRTTDKIEIYRVKTGSMEEKIHVGDYILIYRKENYEVGDVVTYTSNDGFITQKKIKKENGKIITKGDANNAEDREIFASTIVGKVIISGGILNYVINYKYIIVCVLLSLYLFSCYFGDGKEKEEPEIGTSDEKNVDEEIVDDKEESIINEENENNNETIEELKEVDKKEKNNEIIEEEKKDLETEEDIKNKEVEKNTEEKKEIEEEKHIETKEIVLKKKTKKNK